MALGHGPQALLTTLYRSTDCLCRSGAAMKNLAQSASLHAGENNAPSKPGTKHLVPARRGSKRPGNEATRFHNFPRRRDVGMAAPGARAAEGDAGDRRP